MKKRHCLLGLILLPMLIGSCRTMAAVSEALNPPTETPRPTRTPRPTFTLALATLLPTVTMEPTQTVVIPSRTATRRPTTTATKTATPKPAPRQLVSTYLYRFYPGSCSDPTKDLDGPCRAPQGVVCHHSGGKEIRVVIYSDHSNPSSLQSGARVAISNNPDGSIIDPIEISGGDGIAHKTLATAADPPSKNNGTYYTWIIDSGGKRISEMSPAIILSDKTPDQEGFCTVAALFFAGGN